MNLHTASVAELEHMRRKAEEEYRAMCQLWAWTPDRRTELAKKEDELYAIARRLDQVCRGGGIR